MSISAKIIADSLSPQGHRLTTFVLVFPRIVLAEFNTHRMLSKNSASSRAIPFNKMVKLVEEDPFIPIRWMKEHKGMQGSDYFEDVEANTLDVKWRSSALAAAKQARMLSEGGLTKQLCNRLLEPFMYHTVIVTGTEWENFFALRAHPQAEIHIADLAEKMLVAYNESTPNLLSAGEWHVPFGDKISIGIMEDELLDKDLRIKSIGWGSPVPGTTTEEIRRQDVLQAVTQEYKIKIATARCARVSYMNFEGKEDYTADIKLHDSLLASGHMSPFEHCARVMNDEEYVRHVSGVLVDGKFKIPSMEEEGDGWCGNFRGFIQYRKHMPGENKSDNRVLKKEYGSKD
jgi:thymidylate synthase ThyX